MKKIFVLTMFIVLLTATAASANVWDSLTDGFEFMTGASIGVMEARARTRTRACSRART